MITPIPYYYLILALIAFTIFVNVRLRDSRLGRAWIAIREDEIAAASSGVNLVRPNCLPLALARFSLESRELFTLQSLVASHRIILVLAIL